MSTLRPDQFPNLQEVMYSLTFQAGYKKKVPQF